MVPSENLHPAMIGDENGHRVECATLAAFALAGFAIVLLVTSQNVGMTPDSAHYVAAARNLVNGEGLTVFVDGRQVPLTHYPPLLPLLLAIAGSLGVDPLIGVRWLNAISFAGSIVFAGYLARLIVPGSALASLAAAFLVLTSRVLYGVHAMAWSEPVFICLTLAGLVLLARYFERQAFWLLVLAAALAGLALMTRYLGIVLILAGVLALFCVDRKSFYDKVAHVVIFGAIACAPLFLWLVRNLMLEDTVANRRPAVHIVSSSTLNDGLETIAYWFASSHVAGSVFGVLVLVGLIIGVLYFRYKFRQLSEGNGGAALRPSSLTTFAAIGIYVGCYPIVVVTSISLFDIHTPLNNRILSPVHLLLLVLLVSTAVFFLRCGGAKWLGTYLAVPLLAVAVVLHVVRAPAWLLWNSDAVMEYGSARWRESETIAFAQQLPPSTVIYTNGPEVIYLRTGVIARRLPLSADIDTLEPNKDYHIALMDMANTLRRTGGYLVYFHGIHPPFLPFLAEFWDKLPFDLVYEANDGLAAKLSE
jgi:4-amino-4-deoxy-L-arabinose transferase-like glycosyltransferase